MLKSIAVVPVTLVLLYFVAIANSEILSAVEEFEPEPATGRSTSTTRAPTTTQPPPPKFPQNVGLWKLASSDQNASCIIFQAAIQLQFIHSDSFGNDSKVVDVPPFAVANGSCEDPSMLQLVWETREKNTTYEMTLEMLFEEGHNELQYDIKRFSVILTKNQEIENITVDSGPYFPVSRNHSFQCNSTSKISNQNLTIVTADLHYEAFRWTNGSGFSAVEICVGDMQSVGIIVGLSVGVFLSVCVCIGLGIYVGLRYGYFSFPCCKRDNGGYNPL